MALNKKILEKIISQTANDENIRDFLTKLIKTHKGERSWFKKSYDELIEKYYEGGSCED